jgi:chemotaxis protein methyltransferase CheR
MTDRECVEFLQWALPRLRFRWPGFRKVRRQVRKRIERRLGQLGLAEIGAYRIYLDAHPAEWDLLDGYCRITISRFYRDRGVFDYLGDEILPELARTAIRRGRDEVRCLSAGCASGEEAYTVLILAEVGRFAQLAGVRLRLVATDADEQMLRRARQARYPASSVKNVPTDWLGGPLERSGEGYVVREDLRAQVEFQRQDIRRQVPDGPWDLVLCRNLAFTYFDEPLQRKVLAKLVGHIRAGGVLVTGKQETLPETDLPLVPCTRHLGVYRVGRQSCPGPGFAARNDYRLWGRER